MRKARRPRVPFRWTWRWFWRGFWCPLSPPPVPPEELSQCVDEMMGRPDSVRISNGLRLMAQHMQPGDTLEYLGGDLFEVGGQIGRSQDVHFILTHREAAAPALTQGAGGE